MVILLIINCLRVSRYFYQTTYGLFQIQICEGGYY